MSRARLAAIAALLFVSILVAGCGDDEPSKPKGPGSVEGLITDIDTSDPITNAAVALVDPRTMATRTALARVDGAGRYRFERMSPGRYSVFVFHSNSVVFDRESHYVEVEAGKTARYDMRLVNSELWSEEIRIVGHVLDVRYGLPVAGAYVGDAISGAFSGEDVWAPLIGIDLPYWTVTDEHGDFAMDALVWTDEFGEPIGLGPISVSKSGFEPASLGGEAPTGPPPVDYSDDPFLLPLPSEGDSVLTVEIVLHPLTPSPETHGGVRGRVLYLDAPVASLPVAISLAWVSDPDTHHTAGVPAVPMPDRIVPTNADGAFLIADLKPGVYSIAPAYLPDDGYVGYDYRSEAGSMIAVIAADTADAGDLPVVKAIRPLFPSDGATIGDGTPALSWNAAALPSGYVLERYELGFADGYVQDVEVMLTGTTWQMPDSLTVPPGEHGRWFVEAFAIAPGGEDAVRVAAFERAATFTVE